MKARLILIEHAREGVKGRGGTCIEGPRSWFSMFSEWELVCHLSIIITIKLILSVSENKKFGSCSLISRLATCWG